MASKPDQNNGGDYDPPLIERYLPDKKCIRFSVVNGS